MRKWFIGQAPKTRKQRKWVQRSQYTKIKSDFLRFVFRMRTYKVRNHFHLLNLFREEPDPGHWENVQEQECGSWSCDCPVRVGLCQGRGLGRKGSQAAAWHFLAGSCKTKIYCTGKELWVKQSRTRIPSLPCPFLSNEQPTHWGNQWL